MPPGCLVRTLILVRTQRRWSEGAVPGPPRAYPLAPPSVPQTLGTSPSSKALGVAGDQVGVSHRAGFGMLRSSQNWKYCPKNWDIVQRGRMQMVRERQPESPRPWGFNVEVARHVPATLRLIIYGALATCRASCSQPQLSAQTPGTDLSEVERSQDGSPGLTPKP